MFPALDNGLRYEITGRLISVHLEGNYSNDRALEIIENALADPAAPDRALLLIDGRKSTADRPTGEIRRLAQSFSK